MMDQTRELSPAERRLAELEAERKRQNKEAAAFAIEVGGSPGVRVAGKIAMVFVFLAAAAVVVLALYTAMTTP